MVAEIAIANITGESDIKSKQATAPKLFPWKFIPLLLL